MDLFGNEAKGNQAPLTQDTL